jgi:hypothetical protein
LRFELFRVALGALGLFLAVDEGFELMLAFFADVFVDWHELLPSLLESICGEFANLKIQWRRSLGTTSAEDFVAGEFTVSRASMAGRRTRADDCQFSHAAQN